MGAPTSKVGYIAATTGRGRGSLYGHVVALDQKIIQMMYISSITAIVNPCGIRCALTFRMYWLLIDEIIHGWPGDVFLEAETCSQVTVSYLNYFGCV
jgi:hypothetical protein